MDVDSELQTLLAEQRRELTAAKVAESDLGFAFQLQMQEAMNASLALQPASSSSSSSAPEFHQPDDAVPDSCLAHLLDAEIERFERERADRDQVEAETRLMRDDLSRRMHDQAFARDLLRVPDEQWMKTGDYIQRPYGEGSSAGMANAGSFRLYFKGLVSEETVGGARKTLAGIGVAICDATDSLIFELWKPLIGVETSGEVAEMKALIEGLDAAVSLGLKRVTIFCPDNSLYHYVTGKGLPRQGQVVTMLDQVSLLQRKFTHCNPALVAQKDIKFALKLAREAIVSQVTQPAKRIRAKNLIETCAICLEDTDASRMFSVNSCLHRYCFSCMKQHVEAKLLQGMLPKCPHEGCKSEMKIESCKKLLTPELFDIMSQRIKENSIPAAEKIYCPFPKCSALMSKHEDYGYATTSFAGAGARKCTKCHGLFCINCKVPWHDNMTCFDYKRANPYPCAEDAKLKNLARRNLWRQCVKCNHMVELAEGCYHIYCRCGYQFCYTCGAEWKNKKATCTCPIWDERNIVYDANNRRQQRRG